MKFWVKSALLVIAFGLFLTTGVWAALEKAEMINGVDWAKWSNQDKLVYIRGICNWIDFDAAAQIQTQARTGKHWFSITMGLAKVLKDKSLGQIVEDVNNYYQNNPGNLDLSVIEVLLKHCAKVCPS